MKKKEYGLLTSIAMIVGIVIGSGIFFKSDNILIATKGSITLGVIVFFIAALGIIFGGLTIGELASRDSRAGGIITYAEDSYNESVACSFGWFHTFVYYPSLIAVISWVTGIYICILLGIEGGLLLQCLIGIGVASFLYVINILSKILGGFFQNAATIIKILPLLLIAASGILFGNTQEITLNNSPIGESISWLAAIAPIAFSLDGWIVSTSIAHEIKDSKKNLPRALIIAPIFIVLIYVLYFVGISIYVGPEQIMALGDAHVDVAANGIFGPLGGNIIITFVVISIVGTLNGLILGYIRMPYSLAIRNMIPNSKGISIINEKLSVSIKSALLSYIFSLIWLVVHYITQKYNLMPNGDVSEISIAVNYLLYILLYFKVFKMGLEGEVKGIWKGKINPILATLGSIITLVGSFSNPMLILYLLISFAVLITAFIYHKNIVK
ncbi:MAG: amino acid permease [Clostridiales bacterium]|nr:amino acid permease [Clostridiales bacterium]